MTINAAHSEPPRKGIPVDRNDATGRPIHVGDWLHFDIHEWGCGCAGPEHDRGCDGVFQITLSGGEIHGNGTPSDWSEFCRIVDGPGAQDRGA